MQAGTNAHSIHHARPAAGLESFVRCYGQRTGTLPSDSSVMQPVHARVAGILEFILGDAIRVTYAGSHAEKSARGAVLIGMQTFRRATLQMSGHVDTFAVLFQPTGLFRLFSVPMPEMADRDEAAEAVLGPGIRAMEDRLAACRTFEERVTAMNRCLLRYLPAGRPLDPVAAAATQILRSPASASIPALAAFSGLGQRQFERRFAAQVGINPKLFACIARFEAVMDRMTRSSGTSWTNAAHRFGYHDQMHLVHDIGRFTGETPTKILSVFRLFFREAVEGLNASADPAHVLCDSRLIL